jgi:phage baseplate assembly protein gpV
LSHNQHGHRLDTHEEGIQCIRTVEERVVLQSDDGATRVSVGATDVRVTAGANVLTVGPDGIVAEVGDTTLTLADDGATIEAPLTRIVGPLTVTGLITAEGGIVP